MTAAVQPLVNVPSTAAFDPKTIEAVADVGYALADLEARTADLEALKADADTQRREAERLRQEADGLELDPAVQPVKAAESAARLRRTARAEASERLAAADEHTVLQGQAREIQGDAG